MSLGADFKENIRSNLLTARKSRSPDVDILTTLVGEIEKGEKSGIMTGREDVVGAVRRLLKGVNESLAVPNTPDAFRTKMAREKEVLERYLPGQMSQADLEEFVRTEIATSNLAGQHIGKATGVIMKALKDQRANQYDGKLAADVIKRELT